MATQSKLTPLGEVVMWVLTIALIGLGLWSVDQKYHFSGKMLGAFERPTKASSVPNELSGIGENLAVPEVSQSNSAVQPSVGGKPITSGCRTNLLTIAWNATMPLHLANGGAETAEGSLMAKYGVRLNVARLDDYGKMQEAQIKFASAVAAGETCPEQGAAFVIIMGDAFASYAQGLSESLGKLDQGVEVVYATGYSYGEDKCMLPVEVAKDPQRARGSLIGAVMRDGDYNICVTWAAQNDIPINPDDKTYDPEAMNFRSVSMFTEADEGVIRGYKEERDVVRGSKRTGERVEVRQNGTATWTPGDVNVARNVGGYVAVASTREYSYQMPATIIGNRDFMKRNPNLVTGMIRALAEAGEAIKTSDEAMMRAAEIEAVVYDEQDAEYWKRYAKGVFENDKLGHRIFLGGSRVNNLADNSFLFGLEGNDNLFRRIYTQFGDHNLKYYPELMDGYPEYRTVVNTSYLAEVLSSSSAARQQADTPTYTQQPIQVVVAKRSWAIEFDTGKSTIRPESLDDLEEMLNQISITNLEVEIRGHTDDVGDSTLNLRLSRERADAVRTFLMENAASNFPENRVSARGYGEMAPIAENTTEAGRQKNRRVEVVLGTN